MMWVSFTTEKKNKMGKRPPNYDALINELGQK
jgi:hypothetical protein